MPIDVENEGLLARGIAARTGLGRTARMNREPGPRRGAFLFPSAVE
jgi:hypothetical protein